jgi:hypothetical protein
VLKAILYLAEHEGKRRDLLARFGWHVEQVGLSVPYRGQGVVFTGWLERYVQTPLQKDQTKECSFLV